MATILLGAMPSAAQAARPKWSSSGVSGVEAKGQYSKSGSRVHIYGTLKDTGGDNKQVRLTVRFSGECCAHSITNKKGVGKSVKVDLTSTRAAHLHVKECKGGGLHIWTCSKWKKIY
ncbi:hypothetical protein [Actinoplanes derwentensis]|uniref:hypothetical protein n=1 Tax=Actinoplanes derwentensis TaxID=113562 RepID=UPI000B85D92D|nr:hypothetical protein [Actinoplanes derwentensis]